MSEAGYPEIEFLETDAETVVSSMIALYEEMLKQAGRENYQVRPASPERLFISWMAAVVIQQRVLINEAAKMNVPRYAAQSENEDYLDSLAELFGGTERLPASPASATFRFYLSEPQAQSTIVPAGTRISYNGELFFKTAEALEIKAGETSGDVLGTCTQSGEAGNGIAPGKVKEVVDMFDHYQKAENVTETAGGAEREGNASYYERMRERMEGFSTAGSVNGYIYHAKSASPAISDVVATSPEPGVVDVRILLQDGELATEAFLKEVGEKLGADDVRPLTDLVRVENPDAVEFSIDATFYIPKGASVSPETVEADVRGAVDGFVRWQTEKMGRDVNPSRLVQMVMAAGAKRVEVRQPSFQTVAETEVARLAGKTVLNGGLEDG